MRTCHRIGHWQWPVLPEWLLVPQPGAVRTVAPGKTLPLPCVCTAFVTKTVPLPCVCTAFVTKTVPLPCVCTAFVTKTVPLPCVSLPSGGRLPRDLPHSHGIHIFPPYLSIPPHAACQANGQGVNALSTSALLSRPRAIQPRGSIRTSMCSKRPSSSATPWGRKTLPLPCVPTAVATKDAAFALRSHRHCL